MAEVGVVVMVLALLAVPGCLLRGFARRRARHGALADSSPETDSPDIEASLGRGAPFFLAAALFLVFQALALVTVAWGLAFHRGDVGGLVETGFFLLPPLVGAIYAWRRGALDG